MATNNRRAHTDDVNNSNGTTTSAGQKPQNVVVRNTTPSEILLIYGLTLMICGALAFYESGLKDKAMSSLYMGNGGAIFSFLLAAGTRKLPVKKGEPGYKLAMISIHVALIFPLIMASVVSWRLSLAWPVPEKIYLRPYLSGIIISSLLTFATLYLFKPQKSDSKKKTTNNVVKSSSGVSDITSQVSTISRDSSTLSEINPVSDSQDRSSVIAETSQNDIEHEKAVAAAAASASDTAAKAVPSHRSSKSGGSEKPHKQHVVRRRPRRAQAL